MPARLLIFPVLVFSFALTTCESVSAQRFGRKEAKPEEKLFTPKVPAKPVEVVDLKGTVVLRNSRRTPGPDLYGGMIIRELMRQSFLIAARDELSLYTRDMALKEAGGEFSLAKNQLLDVRCYPKLGKNLKIEVRKLAKDKSRTSLLQTVHPMPKKILDSYSLLDIHVFLDLAEKHSRGDFVITLKKAGYAGKPLKQSPNLKVPDDVEQALNKMTFMSQYSALRKLHQLMREKGQSRFTLGALVRGYANLGVLTERLWSPAHKVFKARALLYAQRLLISDQHSAWSYWHRGYAFALCGYHHFAEKDFQQAKSKTKQDKAKLSKPNWVDLLQDFYRFELAAFDSGKRNYGQNHELAIVLRTLAIEYPTIYSSRGANSSIPHQVFIEQEALRRALPESIRVHEAYCQLQPEFYDDSHTSMPMKSFTSTLYEKLPKIETLPDAVLQLIREKNKAETEMTPNFNEFDVRGKIIQSLHHTVRTNKDRHEFTFSVLAHLIHETSFLHIWRHVKYLREEESDYPVSYINKTANLLVEHPMFPFIQYYGTSEDRDRYLKNFAKKIDMTDVLRGHIHVRKKLYWVERKYANRIFNLIMYNEDQNYRGFAYLIQNSSTDKNVRIALDLKATSPHSPLTATMLARYHWKTQRKNAPYWAKRFSKNAELLDIISYFYMQERRYSEAQSILRKVVQIKPTWRAYQRMADSFRLQGNTKQWIATINEYLARDMKESQRREARLQLARYFLSQYEYKKALAYSKDAMKDDDPDDLDYDYQTVAIAIECYEYLRDWASAEQHMKMAVDEAYSTGESWALHWYYLCKRSGQGDITAARRTAMEYVDGIDATIKRFHPKAYSLQRRQQYIDSHALYIANCAMFHVIDQQPEKSIELLKKSLAYRVNPYESLHLALVALEMNNLELFNTTLLQCEKQGGKYLMQNRKRLEMVQLAKIFRVASADKKNPGEIDLGKINQMIEKAPMREQNNLYYFVARYLELNNDKKTAVKYYRLCIQQPVLKINRTLACMMMREMGNDPTEIHCIVPKKKAATKISTPKK